MKLTSFIENRFQELRMDEDVHTNYSILRASETLALQTLLGGIRSFLKWLLIPKLIGHYFLCAVGAVRKPEPVLTNKLRENQHAELVAQQMRADIANKHMRLAEAVIPQEPSPNPTAS